MAKVVLCRNPFRPQAERDLVSVRAGTRIDTMLRQQSLVKGRASRLQRLSTFVVQVNGTYLLADQWARRIRNEDVVVVSLLPGDGGGGSNPLKMVLQIALIAAAVYTGGGSSACLGSSSWCDSVGRRYVGRNFAVEPGIPAAQTQCHAGPGTG